MSETVVLCAANAYDQKYYLNPEFDKLPQEFKDDLKVISVLFTEEIGGYFIIQFDEEGKIEIKTEARASDYNYDDIGAALMVKEIQKSRWEMLRNLELYYRVFFLHIPLEEA